MERSSQALGYISSAIWGGVSAGPALGHWLGVFSHAAFFQMIAGIMVVGLAFFVSEDFKPKPASKRRSWFPRHILMPGLAIGFVNVQYPVVAGYLILHLAHHGNSGQAAFHGLRLDDSAIAILSWQSCPIASFAVSRFTVASFSWPWACR